MSKKLEDRDWWDELVELKDVMSLRELSARFGAAPAAISNALKRNGLKRTPAPPGPRDKRDQALLKAQQVALDAVEKGEPVPEAAKEVAKEVATDGAATSEAPAPKKKAAKKAAKKATRKKKSGGRRGGSAIEPYADLLGVEIDRIIAEKAGVSVSAVTNYRKRNGIPAATRGGRKAAAAKAAKAAAPKAAAPKAAAPKAAAPKAAAPKAAAPKAAAPKAAAPKAKAAAPAVSKAGSVGYGYRVSIGGEGFVVVAGDIAEAASIALASGRGEVTGIELLGGAIG